jgi:tetraacyldisaccharide-1-P 4'-kinase
MHAAGRADLTAGFADDWKDVEPYPKLLFEYVPSHLVQRGDAGSFSTTPLEPHRNLPVYLVSGIARPQRFEETVRDGGFNIVGKSVFEDHHRFSDKDNISIASKAKAWGAKIILTTEKDLVRMFRFTSDLPLFALRVDVKLASGPDILSDSLASLAT